MKWPRVSRACVWSGRSTDVHETQVIVDTFDVLSSRSHYWRASIHIAYPRGCDESQTEWLPHFVQYILCDTNQEAPRSYILLVRGAITVIAVSSTALVHICSNRERFDPGNLVHEVIMPVPTQFPVCSRSFILWRLHVATNSKLSTWTPPARNAHSSGRSGDAWSKQISCLRANVTFPHY